MRTRRFFDSSLSSKPVLVKNLRGISTFFQGSPLEPYYQVPQSPDLTDLLQRVDERKKEIKLAQSRTNGNLQTVIHNKLRCRWTFHSNALEGSKLTLGDTIFFLQEGLTVSGKPLKDFLDAKNHAGAIDYLYEVVKNAYPIDAFLLSSINSLLLAGVEYIPGKDAAGNTIQKPVMAGQYKRDPNYVLQPDGTIHEYVEPYLVSPQIDGLCQWIAANPDNYHPVVCAAIAHYNHVRIHPFQDGNGRGARLLMNLILLREKYHPAVIAVEDRKSYLVNLKAADRGDLLPFVHFVAQSVMKTQGLVLSDMNEYLAERPSLAAQKN